MPNKPKLTLVPKTEQKEKLPDLNLDQETIDFMRRFLSDYTPYQKISELLRQKNFK